MTKAKRVVRIKLSDMTDEQRHALRDLYSKCRATEPWLREMGETALKMMNHLVQEPYWTPSEGVKPDDETRENKAWTVGRPEINYVESIELVGRQDNAAQS